MPSSCNVTGFKLAHDQCHLQHFIQENKQTNKTKRNWFELYFEALQMFTAMGYTKNELLVAPKDFSGLIKKNPKTLL